MKKELQRIAIAGACDFDDIALRLIAEGTGMDQWVWCSGIIGHGGVELPDYPNDLNAMHEAEKGLRGMDRNEYARHLFCAIQAPKEIPNTTWEKAVFATAAQRAEAFLRTLNLWDDSK